MGDNSLDLPFLNKLDYLTRSPLAFQNQNREGLPPGGIPETNLSDEQKQNLLNQFGGNFEKPVEKNYSGSANPSAWVSQYMEEAKPEASQPKDPLASFQPASGPQPEINSQAASQPAAVPDSPEGVAANKNIAAMKAYLASIDPKNLPGRADQLDTINRLKAYRGIMPVQSEGVNLRPALAWADSLAPGSTLAKNYEDPKTAEDRIGKVNQLSETISGLSGKLNAEDLATLRDKLMGNIALTRFGQDKSTADKTKQEANMFVKANTDIQQMRGNKALQNAMELQRLSANARAIAEPYKNNLDAMPNDLKTLLDEEISKIATAGVAAQGTIESISDPTLRSSFAKFVQHVTNAPVGVGQGKFIQNKMQYLNDLDKGSSNLIRSSFERKLNTWKPHLAPSDYQNIKDNFEMEYGAAGANKNPSEREAPSAPVQANTPASPPQIVENGVTWVLQPNGKYRKAQ